MECWSGDDLVGGLYGVSIGGAFFGESMFSRATDASKIALVHLVAHLIDRGFLLLDAQFHNPHLEQFGLVEISRANFKQRLKEALGVKTSFKTQSIGSGSSGSSTTSTPPGMSSYKGSADSGIVTRSGPFTGAGAVQRITQMS